MHDLIAMGVAALAAVLAIALLYPDWPKDDPTVRFHDDGEDE